MKRKSGKSNWYTALKRRVERHFTKEKITFEIKQMGYMGIGSKDDEGCVQLVYIKLDNELERLK